MAKGTTGIFHGMKSYFCQDKYGQIAPVYSISAGLDYPGVGPEHSYLKDVGRVEYTTASDKETLDAFLTLSRVEGIIPALESAHAVAWAIREAPKHSPDVHILVNLSGRAGRPAGSLHPSAAGRHPVPGRLIGQHCVVGVQSPSLLAT